MRGVGIALGLVLAANAVCDAEAGIPLARDLRIAVVDLSVLFRDYKESKVMKQALSGLEKDYKKQVERLQRRVAQKRSELGEFAAGTAKHMAKREELLERQKELRALQMSVGAKHNAESVKSVKSVYDAIDAGVKAYAKEQHIDLVLKQQSMIDFDQHLNQMTTAGLIMGISRRSVMFHGTSIDITGAVLRRLDAAYEKRLAEKNKRAAK